MKKVVKGNIEKWYHEGDLRKIISYYNNGQRYYEEYYLNNKWHRDGGQPALIRWYKNGQKAYKLYYKNGKRHRDGGQPARIDWHKNGQKSYEAYWLNGRKLTEREVTLLNRKRKLNKLIYEED